MSNTDMLAMRVLATLGAVLAGWAVLAFVYAGLFVQAILYLLYIGFVLVLILHRMRSAKRFTLRGRKT